MPQYGWNTAAVGVKHQTIDQPICDIEILCNGWWSAALLLYYYDPVCLQHSAVGNRCTMYQVYSWSIWTIRM